MWRAHFFLILLIGAFASLSGQNASNPTSPGFPGNLSTTDPGSISVPSGQNINNIPPQNLPGGSNPPVVSPSGYTNGNINNPDQNHLSGTTGPASINNSAPGQNYPSGYTGNNGFYPNGALGATGAPAALPQGSTGPTGLQKK